MAVSSQMMYSKAILCNTQCLAICSPFLQCACWICASSMLQNTTRCHHTTRLEEKLFQKSSSARTSCSPLPLYPFLSLFLNLRARYINPHFTVALHKHQDQAPPPPLTHPPAAPWPPEWPWERPCVEWHLGTSSADRDGICVWDQEWGHTRTGTSHEKQRCVGRSAAAAAAPVSGELNVSFHLTFLYLNTFWFLCGAHSLTPVWQIFSCYWQEA